MNRFTVIGWRRRIAHQEARALRAYLRATGRYPRHAPTDWAGMQGIGT